MTRNSVVECGVAAMILPGEVEMGDRHVILESDTGVLIAVVDGLGHGKEAAAAAQIAVEAMRNHAQESVLSLVRRCHERLRGTRGVVLSMASVNALENTLTWLGVGNVQGILLHRDSHGTLSQEELSLRGGVVGDQLPNLSATILPVSRGDTLIFATDGIRSDFVERVSTRQSEQETANYILAHFARGTDDALALVARYSGMPREGGDE